MSRKTNWPAAIGRYESWLTNYPADSLQPQAVYARAWADFQAGNETNAFVLFTNFVAQFPTNELAPLAQWWVAEHFFRAGDFVNAERNYKSVFQNTNWQDSPLVYPAQMMAGRAAVGRLGYSDAIGYFTALADDTNCPPELNVQARFAWGTALMQMNSADTNNPAANFQAATNVFAQICKSYPTNELGAHAWGEIGDCDLQLTNFDAATNAYAQVFNSPFADVSARSQAQVGLRHRAGKDSGFGDGRRADRICFNLALNEYLDVFDGKKICATAKRRIAFWMEKAGLQAVSSV